MTNEKRKTAIKWLQNEIRSLRLAPTINGCGPENWADLLEIMQTCLEAVRAYPPARIDREAWKPCECCNGAKYVYGQASAVVPNGDKGQIEKEVEGDFDYCPECGRPLTPEAWAMLEKRLRG